MARKGKSMEEIISALREAEFVLDSETAGLICRLRHPRSAIARSVVT